MAVDRDGGADTGAGKRAGGKAVAAEVRLDAAHAAVSCELAELLAFLSDWLGGGDAGVLGVSLRRFVGGEGYDVARARGSGPVRGAAGRGWDGERLFSGRVGQLASSSPMSSMGLA
jgi:hypothetical protein